MLHNWYEKCDSVSLLLLRVILSVEKETECVKVVSFFIKFVCFNVMVQNGRRCLCECVVGEWLKQAVDWCDFENKWNCEIIKCQIFITACVVVGVIILF